MAGNEQHRLSPGRLLDKQGVLAEAGYDTSLSRAYDRADIAAPSWRVKEWDYYLVICRDYALALTVADNSYMGLESVSLLDFRTGFQHTKSFMRLLPMGKTALPFHSREGVTSVARKKYSLCFTAKDGVRTLEARVDDFKDGKPLTASVVLTGEPRDSMVIATPFAQKKTAFYYNQKINCLRAEGSASFDGATYAFRPTESAPDAGDAAMAVLDWGRGVWTYRNTWYWGSVSAWINGAPFGLNMGYGFGDTSAASENMIFFDGEAHKLGGLTFEIPRAGKAFRYTEPWRVYSDDGRLNLTFQPILDRASLTNALVLKSDQHQVFGRFSGEAKLDDGRVVCIENVIGFAERVTNLW